MATEEVRRLIQDTFRLRQAGESKVMPLAEAVRRQVKPGMSLFLTRYSGAIAYELIRQFWGKDPRFTLIAFSIRDHIMNVVQAGLVERAIITSASYGYPSPAPIPLVQERVRQGTLKLECWSLLSLFQRFMAGAMGYPFMPTKSIRGSTMALENRDQFKLIPDPFGSGQEVALVKALHPDLALVHGCVADEYGNTIVPCPWEDPAWAPWASRGGVLVTVEKIVPTDYIRENAGWVRIPGYMVNSVSVAPLGSHPLSTIHHSLPGFDSYGSDYEFLLRQREASQDPARAQAWLKEWVLDCPDQETYVTKLGEERVYRIKGWARWEAWQFQIRPVAEKVSAEPPANAIEMMVVAAARKLSEIIRQKGYCTALVGVGTSGLTGWLAYYTLLRQGYPLDLILGSGLLGYAPRPGDPYLTNISNIPTATMLTTTLEAYGVFVGGETNKCISVLAGVQVDKLGNINSHRINTRRGELFLTGTGGGNDAVNGRESLLVMRQTRTRLVEKVDYISCPGDRVTTLVTHLGTMEKPGGEGEFVLTALPPDKAGRSIEDRVAEVRANCGWEMKVAPQLAVWAPPTTEELLILRALDPEAFFLRED